MKELKSQEINFVSGSFFGGIIKTVDWVGRVLTIDEMAKIASKIDTSKAIRPTGIPIDPKTGKHIFP